LDLHYFPTRRSSDLKQARLKYKVKLAQIEAVKEKELNERKLSFFTNISHEFRSPLTLILNPVKELMYNNGQGVNATNLNIVYRKDRKSTRLNSSHVK